MRNWKVKKIEKGRKIRHIIYAVYYTEYLPLSLSILYGVSPLSLSILYGVSPLLPQYIIRSISHLPQYIIRSISPLPQYIIRSISPIPQYIIRSISPLPQYIIRSISPSTSVYYTEYLPLPQYIIRSISPSPSAYYTDSGVDNDHSDEELVDLSEDASLKLNFNRRKLIQFWLSVQQTRPTLSTEALKVLLPFSSSYICEVGFSATVGMKTRFRNKLKMSNSLRLEITRIDVDVNTVINSNRKQAHQSHTPHYQKYIVFFL
jgi:hypothetical protein